MSDRKKYTRQDTKRRKTDLLVILVVIFAWTTMTFFFPGLAKHIGAGGLLLLLGWVLYGTRKDFIQKGGAGISNTLCLMVIAYSLGAQTGKYSWAFWAVALSLVPIAVYWDWPILKRSKDKGAA